MTDMRVEKTATPRLAWRSLRAPVAVAAAAVVAVGVVATVDPNEQGHYPTCPFLAATGLFCPGCGSLRAVHALAGGDVATAFERNPLMVLVVPFLLWSFVRWTGATLGWLRPRTTVAPAWALWGLAAVVVGYGILRNVPGLTLLSPA